MTNKCYQSLIVINKLKIVNISPHLGQLRYFEGLLFILLHFLESTKRHQDWFLIRNVAFQACMNGSFGWNCESPCVTGYYGFLCKTPCECLHHFCDKETGCQSKHNETCKFYPIKYELSLFLFHMSTWWTIKKSFLYLYIIRDNFKMFECFSSHQLHPDYLVYNKLWKHCKSGKKHR